MKALRHFSGKLALVLIDMEKGYMKRYVYGRPGHALLSDHIQFQDWDRTVEFDREKIEAFRSQPGSLEPIAA
jgi:hypothetical protein